MPNILTDLVLDELSLVDKPANKDARVSIFKRAGTAVPDDEESGKEDTVTDKTTDVDKTEDNRVQELMTSVADLQKQVNDLKAVGEFSPEEFAFYKNLPDEQKVSFRKAEDNVRKNYMSNEETLEVNGATIRKTDVGDAMFQILKSQKEQNEATQAALAKSQSEAHFAAVAKTVQEEFSKAVGTSDQKAKLLIAVESNSELSEYAKTLLRANEQMVDKAFDTVGHRGEPTNGAATEKYNQTVSEIMSRDKISKSAAASKLRVEFPEVFKAAYPDHTN